MLAHMSNDELLKAADVAQLLGISVDSLYQLRYLHHAPPAIKIRGRLRWRRSDIDRWLDGQAEQSSASRHPSGGRARGGC